MDEPGNVPINTDVEAPDDVVKIRQPSADQRRIKRFLSHAVIALFLFLNGVQYVLILPTAYNYIVLQLHGNTNQYGFVLAFFSLSGLFANILFGYLADGTMSVKVAATISNIFLMIGSFMYFMGVNVWFVMLSRFVSGIGTGAGASYWADLARNTPDREKTRIFSVIMLFRQLGIIVGPAFNLLFEGLFAFTDEYKFGPFSLTIGSIPGLFMAAVWFLMIFFCIFCYTDLDKLSDTPNSRSFSNDVEAKTENTQLIENPTTNDSKLRPTIRGYCSALTKADVICLQFVLFIMCFIQTALEAMLPPLSYLYVEWSENETSLWFLVNGLITVLLFILVSGPLTAFFHDFWMTLFGIFLEILSFPFLIAMSFFCLTCCNHFLGRLAPNDPAAFPLFLTGFIFNTLGLPFIAACTVSLFSNAIAPQYQGMAHGIRRSLTFLGYLFGPIWGGAFMPFLQSNFIALFVMYILIFVMVLASKPTLQR